MSKQNPEQRLKDYMNNPEYSEFQAISRKANQMKSDATFKEIENLYLWAKKYHKKGVLL